jgi:hypothetical protein
MYCVAIRFLLLALAMMSPSSQGQIGEPAKPAAELAISGPQVVHRGDNLWFTATLTNRSNATIALPSSTSSICWWYMIEGGWSITDKKGKELPSKPTGAFDNTVSMPTFKDSDFVLLKPGEKIEYNHETLGDPSDTFLFPGNGFFEVSLRWHFCAPTVKDLPNGTVAYTCGVTRLLSQPVREILLATPSFDVNSNVWNIRLK